MADWTPPSSDQPSVETQGSGWQPPKEDYTAVDSAVKTGYEKSGQLDQERQDLQPGKAMQFLGGVQQKLGQLGVPVLYAAQKAGLISPESYQGATKLSTLPGLQPTIASKAGNIAGDVAIYAGAGVPGYAAAGFGSGLQQAQQEGLSGKRELAMASSSAAINAIIARFGPGSAGAKAVGESLLPAIKSTAMRVISKGLVQAGIAAHIGLVGQMADNVVNQYIGKQDTKWDDNLAESAGQNAIFGGTGELIHQSIEAIKGSQAPEKTLTPAEEARTAEEVTNPPPKGISLAPVPREPNMPNIPSRPFGDMKFPPEEPFHIYPKPSERSAVQGEPNAPPIGQALSSLKRPLSPDFPNAASYAKALTDYNERVTPTEKIQAEPGGSPQSKALAAFNRFVGPEEPPEISNARIRPFDQEANASRDEYEGRVQRTKDLLRINMRPGFSEQQLDSMARGMTPHTERRVNQGISQGRRLSDYPKATPEEMQNLQDNAIFTEPGGTNPVDKEGQPLATERREVAQQQNAQQLADISVKQTQAELPLWMRDTTGGFDPKTVKELTSKLTNALTDGGKAAVKSVNDLINGGHGDIKGWFKNTVERAGEKISNLMGANFGRTAKSKQAIDAIRQIDSDSNQHALKLEATFNPFIGNYGKNPNATMHLDRLIDEVEAGQTPSNPGAKSFANFVRTRNQDMKDWALKLGVKGAEHWDINRIGRTAAPLDVQGRPAYDPYYEGPPSASLGGSIGGPQDHIYSRKLTGGRDEFKTALAAKKWGEKFADPVTGMMYKHAQLYRYLSTLESIKNKTIPNRELELGEKLKDGEKLLNDRMFNPFPRKFTAPYSVAGKLNDNTRPISVRRSEFIQGIKDGTLSELAPHEPNSLLEQYLDDPTFESHTPAQESEVYEKQNAKGDTSEFGKTRDIAEATHTHTSDEHATGKFTATYPEGSIPQGHIIVDDALAQAFDKRRFVAPEYAADVINNHLQENVVDPKNPFVNMWNKVNKGALQVYMAGTPYHYLNLAQAGSAPLQGEAFNSLIHGDVLGAARNAAKAVPIANIRDLWDAGEKLKEAFGDPSLHQEMQPAAKAIAEAGGVVEKPSFLKPVQKPVGYNIIRGMSNFLFDKYGENLRRGSTFYAVQNELERATRDNIPLDSDEFKTRAKAAIESVHNSFDTLRTDKGFQDKLSNLVMKSVFAFPRWTISKWKLGVDALKDIPQSIRDRDLTPAQKSVIGNLTTTALIGASISMASTGQLPSKPADFFYPMFPNGKRYTIPSPMQPLFSLMFNHGNIAQYLGNRLNPSIRAGQELYENKDARGQQTRGSVEDVAATIGQELHPGLGNAIRGQGDMVDNIASFFGVKPAPNNLDWTSAEQMAHDLIATHSEVGSKSDEQVQHRDLFNSLLTGLRNNVRGIRDKIADAHKNGELNDNDRHNLFKYSKEGTGIASLIQAKELAPGDVLKIWETMNTTEKAATKGIVRRKIAGARSLTPSQRQAYFQEVNH